MANLSPEQIRFEDILFAIHEVVVETHTRTKTSHIHEVVQNGKLAARRTITAAGTTYEFFEE